MTHISVISLLRVKKIVNVRDGCLGWPNLTTISLNEIAKKIFNLEYDRVVGSSKSRMFEFECSVTIFRNN